ncbi:SAM-dependent methyltransferase [Helicobacter monodelphidis]|uniref:N-6 DNA methylase n=1 Tax=Helicobacter sp. 15-1451 TaxID=2004995 RepID=UPI000DCBBF92|nr:N-6 DNA methylase [Helicobacter sp. 15-1451]RAX57319.1 SAM-dependent methyltransferase [Helicobacter sp. 15-1451]
MTQQIHLNRQQMINQGSFYTPNHVVELVYQLLESYLRNFRLDKRKTQNLHHLTLLDSSCGYGSFLINPPNLQLKFHQKIGCDIDKNALQKAQELLESDDFHNLTLLHQNTLCGLIRKDLNIKDNDTLIIIGNPPYNDKTSIVRQKIKNDRESCITDSIPLTQNLNTSFAIDSSLKHRDIGVSFLRSFDRLEANIICVLHPLSYLIKESNFKALKSFAKNYILRDSIIISSQVFCPKSSGFFPIIIALYERNTQGMDYELIKNYTFRTLEGRGFCLNDFDFIAHYIDKYPNKKRVPISQKKAMFYTLRDINALRRSKTFITKENANAVYVTPEKYSLYCYVDVLKQIISHIPYYLGNCDVMIDYERFKKLESHFIKASESKILVPQIVGYFKDLLGEHYED